MNKNNNCGRGDYRENNSYIDFGSTIDVRESYHKESEPTKPKCSCSRDFHNLQCSTEENSRNTEKKSRGQNVTLLDLSWEDRQRVGKLIKELTMAYEKIASLESANHEANEEIKKYKDKCSLFMQKVDAMTERCHKLAEDKATMKEQHLESLTRLHDKVGSISKQFDASVNEIKTLSKEKHQLKLEIQLLKDQLEDALEKCSQSEESILTYKEKYKESIQRESALRHEILKLKTDFSKSDDLVVRREKQLPNNQISSAPTIPHVKSHNAIAAECHSSPAMFPLATYAESEEKLLETLFFKF